MRNAVLLAAVLAFSAQAAEPITAAQVDDVVARAMKSFNVPGVAVAIVKDDKVVHSKGYGVAALNTGAKVDSHTLFGIASNSKAFTTAALAMLVEEKKLKWDDKVIDIIPEFRMYNPYVTDEFTITDLLTHRSGLGLGAGDLMLFPEGSDFTRSDVIRNLRYLKPTSSFRSKYDYDNNLYIVAGEVVARVSGMSWEDFIEKRIMRPLGMNDSAASRRRTSKRDWIAQPHVAIEGKVQQIDAEIGEVSNAAGGIVSNLDDMSKWVRMQLNGGKYGDGKHLFSEASQWTMWSPQTIMPLRSGPTPYNTHFSAYGLGWGLQDMRGYKQVSHTGGLSGMVTQVTLLPELKLGIVVLTNQEEGAAFYAISASIKDAYFGMPAVDRVAEQRKRWEAQHAEESKELAAVNAMIASAGKAPDAAPLLGTYRDAWFGDITISQDKGKLSFQARRSPKLAGEMQFYKANTWIVKWKDRSMNADAFVNFALGSDGKPARMTMAAISPLTDFSYDFQDLDFAPVK